MANASDRARWRRAFEEAFQKACREMVRLAGAAIMALRHRLAVLLAALSDRAKTGFARHFDGGYEPDPRTGPPQRGDGAIAVRNLSVGYGEHLALSGVTGDFAPASMTAIVGPNGAGKARC